MSDLEDVDPEFSKNLEFILEQDIGDDLGISFTYILDKFGT